MNFLKYLGKLGYAIYNFYVVCKKDHKIRDKDGLVYVCINIFYMVTMRYFAHMLE